MLLSLSRPMALALGLLLCSVPALSVPVDAVLSGTDGNFTFSVFHSSTGGFDGQSGNIEQTIALGSGGTAVVVGSVLTLNLELEVQNSGGGSIGFYQAVGAFDVAALQNPVNAVNTMLGSLNVSFNSGTDVLGVGFGAETFYFEDNTYSSAALPPNSLSADGTILTLWGATQFGTPGSGAPTMGGPLDLEPGGRGVDLRIKFSSNPIPEPTSVALYAMGLGAVGVVIGRNRRRSSAQD